MVEAFILVHRSMVQPAHLGGEVRRCKLEAVVDITSIIKVESIRCPLQLSSFSTYVVQDTNQGASYPPWVGLPISISKLHPTSQVTLGSVKLLFSTDHYTDFLFANQG